MTYGVYVCCDSLSIILIESKYEINERRKLLIALGTSKLEAKKNK